MGSLIILLTSRFAILPASFVAYLYESLKYAGTVTTASLMGFPKYASAVSFILIKTNAPIYYGEYLFPFASTHASPFPALTTLYGRCLRSFYVASSSNLLPINLLLAKIVFSGFVTAYLYNLIIKIRKLWIRIKKEKF